MQLPGIYNRSKKSVKEKRAIAKKASELLFDGMSVFLDSSTTAGFMLRSARGNSGAILSLFFRGIGKALKGVDEAGSYELVEAFKTVSADKKDVYRVLVGMLDDAKPIKAENLEYAKTQTNVVMTGNVPPSEVYYHMAMFDVLTHPTYREGFGKVLQEAMGVGLPIITTNVPGPSEVVEDGVSGILCEVKNASDLADKMLTLYNDKSLCEKLAASGLVRAEKYFDRPIMLENILRDMNEICGMNERG